MSFTIKNLREVEDSAPEFGFEAVQEAHFAHGDLEAETIGFAYLVVKPGQRQAFAHRHENAEEVYVVLSGTGRVKLDDELRDVKPMDAIRIAPPVVRAFEAGPDERLELLAFGPQHERDGEIVPDPSFWEGA
jgi:mannose-6-phosphate isomerase-like protein (cupin superfamily)